MTLKLYQVDAFTNKVFSGNPAAVCPLKEWLDDGIMQNIASENNLSETAFFVEEDSNFRIRWFTPTSESIYVAMLLLLLHMFYLISEIIQKIRLSTLQKDEL